MGEQGLSGRDDPGSAGQLSGFRRRRLCENGRQAAVDHNGNDDIADHGSLLIDQSEMYIPENFLLKEDGVEFLYNQYEIFPYAHGPSFITLPYSDLSKYMLY